MGNDTRMIEFAGRQWVVKSGCGRGPGPNCWSDSEQSVWIDKNGWLHLRIRKENSIWTCAEIYTKEYTHYGQHYFFTIGRLDNLDPNVVFAPFLYKDDLTEIDIEFTRWGELNPPGNAQYVVQPFDKPGNLEKFWLALKGNNTTHSIDWQAGSIRFKSVHGHDIETTEVEQLIYEWGYSGTDIPFETQHLRVHINLWLHQGQAPLDGHEVEIIVKAANLPVPQMKERGDKDEPMAR